MELARGRIGAGRRIEPEEADLAAAVFLSVHRECGESAHIYPAKDSLRCHCASCGVSRLYTYGAEENGGTLPGSNGAA